MLLSSLTCPFKVAEVIVGCDFDWLQGVSHVEFGGLAVLAIQVATNLELDVDRTVAVHRTVIF